MRSCWAAGAVHYAHAPSMFCGRVFSRLTCLRGWSSMVPPPLHGHAARWHARVRVRGPSASGDMVGLQQMEPEHAGATTAFGKVMQAQANFVRVRIDRVEGLPGDAELPQSQLLCVVRTLLKKIRQTVLVGDDVEVTGIDWVDGRGMVQEVLPRRNSLSDPAIANIDQALMVFSLAQPPFEAATATRFLVTAEQAGIPVKLVLNKADLLPPEELQDVISRVRSWGYAPETVSAHSGLGLQQLLDSLVGKVSVLAGPSGVGKSSLLNALSRNVADSDAEDTEATISLDDLEVQPERGQTASPAAQRSTAQQQSGEAAGASSSNGGARSRAEWSALSGLRHPSPERVLDETAPLIGDEIEGMQRVGSVSSIGRGKHTTRTVTLLRLRSGGLIADTPGFNQPALEAVSTEQLPGCFTEITDALEEHSCRFSNCQHVHEPGCIVRGDWERYPFYLEILDEVKAKEDRERHRSASKRQREGRTRMKSKTGGGVQREALLDSKSHRKQSRKKQNQTIQQVIEEEMEEDGDEEYIAQNDGQKRV